MEIIVNGQAIEFSVDPRTSVLDLLRDHLGLTAMPDDLDAGGPGATKVPAEPAPSWPMASGSTPAWRSPCSIRGE